MSEVHEQTSAGTADAQSTTPEQSTPEAPASRETSAETLQDAPQPAAASDIATGQVDASSAGQEANGAAAVAGTDANGAGLDVILHIPVTVQVVLGRAKMPISRLMSLGPGAVVPLDRKAGEPVEVVVNGRLVARGEVVLLDDGVRFGISLTEIVEPGARTC